MPRKEYLLKNRYCRRSKLTESEFKRLVGYYFHEILIGNTRENYRTMYWLSGCYNDFLKSKSSDSLDPDDHSKYIKRRARHANFANVPLGETGITRELAKDFLEGKIKTISEKSIGNYFNRMSTYIWERFIVEQQPWYREEGALDVLLNLIYEKEKDNPFRKELFTFLHNDFPLNLETGKVERSLMFYLLSNRSKAIRGFKKETIRMEFSRVYYVCAAIESQNIKLRSLSAVKEEANLLEIIEMSQNLLLQHLEEQPM